MFFLFLVWLFWLFWLFGLGFYISFYFHELGLGVLFGVFWGVFSAMAH
jgi:hypothetical protein